MRRTKIYSQVLYDNLMKNVILFICASLFAFSMVEVLCETIEARKLIKMMMNKAIDNVMLVGVESEQDEVILNIQDEISQLSNVDVLYDTIPIFAYDHDNQNAFQIDLWGYGLKENQKLDLLKGRMPRSANEIVLSEEHMTKYGLNQSVLLETESFEDWNNMENITENSVELVVVGFYKNDSIIPCLSGYDTYDSFASDLFDTSNSKRCGYVISLIDVDGEKVNFNFNKTPVLPALVVKNNSDEKQEIVKNEICNKLEDYTVKVFTANELRYNYLKSCRVLALRYLSKTIANITVLTITLFSYFYLAMIKKSKEWIIYYLYGMTWTNILKINALTLLPGILLGDIFGYVLKTREQMRLQQNNNFNIENLIVTIVTTLVILGIFIMPLFVHFLRNNPIENLARTQND